MLEARTNMPNRTSKSKIKLFSFDSAQKALIDYPCAQNLRQFRFSFPNVTDSATPHTQQAVIIAKLSSSIQ
jgi:hypothetical protein